MRVIRKPGFYLLDPFPGGLGEEHHGIGSQGLGCRAFGFRVWGFGVLGL